MSHIRIIIVEPAVDEAAFLREALAEIQEGAVQGSWTSFEVTHVMNMEDARDFAVAAPPDVILLNARTDGTGPLAALGVLREAVPNVPVVVLLERAEESIAPHLLRAGAQDYVVKEELECVPLARAIGNAILRQKVVNALRQAAAFDGLTGMYNERGFWAAAEREMDLASAVGRPVTLVVAELEGSEELATLCGPVQWDLAMLSASEVFRAGGGRTALLGCLEGRRLVAMTWDQEPEQFINRVQSALGAQIRDFALRFGWSARSAEDGRRIDSLYDEALFRMCENEASRPHVHPSLSTPPIPSATISPA